MSFSTDYIQPAQTVRYDYLHLARIYMSINGSYEHCNINYEIKKRLYIINEGIHTVNKMKTLFNIKFTYSKGKEMHYDRSVKHFTIIPMDPDDMVVPS